MRIVDLAVAGAAEVLDKKLNVPDSWLRGFLQVQSATTFPLDSFQLAPIDCRRLTPSQMARNGQRVTFAIGRAKTGAVMTHAAVV